VKDLFATPLRARGILERSVAPDDARRVEYRMTEKGRALFPVLSALGALSNRHAISFQITTLVVGVYAAIASPMAQPRNLVGGHMLSGFMGVLSYQLWGSTPWLAAGLGVSGAIVAMLVTRTVHPPGGATALLAVIGGPKLHALGYWYVLVPAGAGACLLLLVALAVNNLAPHRRYPEYWW